MKTKDLIATLAADATPRSRPVWAALTPAVAVGAAAAGVAFALTMGLRDDILEALETWRFLTKLALVGIAGIAAGIACVRLSRPTIRGWAAWSWVATLLAAALAMAIGLELTVTPQSEWWSDLVGSNAFKCLVAIPGLAVLVLPAILWAMRRGAPRSPTQAGLAAGALAGAVAALLYATNCFDDSPLFVATWYAMAIGSVALLGAVIGARVLRW